MKLKTTIHGLTLLLSLIIFLLPVYFMFTYSPFMIFGFLISWLPALIIFFLGDSFAESI